MTCPFGNPSALGITLAPMNLSQGMVDCMRRGYGTTWKWDPATATCSIGGGGIPTYAYVAGGVAAIGAIYYFFLR